MNSKLHHFEAFFSPKRDKHRVQRELTRKRKKMQCVERALEMFSSGEKCVIPFANSYCCRPGETINQ
jgi:hypothetical protein